VTLSDTIVKEKAKKIRRMYKGTILAGFAGAAADAFTLFEKLEEHLDTYQGHLPRATVELAKAWRTDKYLRRLEALLAVMDREHAFLISGSGEIIEPDDGIVAIGSGGPFALAATRALIQYSSLDAKEIVAEALRITASICIYTNSNILVEVL
jgi:ATP-dependent HslUV protease subunit HslV